MLYYREISLKDQRKCLLKNAERADAAAFLHYFTQAHAETDFLTTYADEGTHSVEDMEERLAAQKASRTEIEICAFVDGILVGSAGNHALSMREKLRHRADFGISILREYWGQGIGAALTGGSAAVAAGIMAERSHHRVVVDGKEVQMEAYVINGNNYVKLRDMGKTVGFEVFWDSDAKCVQVKSGIPYTGEAPAKAEPDKPESHPEPAVPANDADVDAMKQDIIDRTD